MPASAAFARLAAAPSGELRAALVCAKLAASVAGLAGRDTARALNASVELIKTIRASSINMNGRRFIGFGSRLNSSDEQSS